MVSIKAFLPQESSHHNFLLAPERSTKTYTLIKVKAFVVFATVMAAASANPQVYLHNGLYGSAITYNGLIGIHHQVISAPAVSYAVPTATKTQYHSQDELGQASYGHAHAGQAHAAVRDAAGNVRGSYAYINPEGKEVRVEYTAGHGGFQVASNALPLGPAPVQPVANLVAPNPVQETPEVQQARAAHAIAHQEALARSGRKKRGIVTSAVLPSTLGYSSVIGHPYGYYGYGAIASPVAYSTIGSPVVASHVVAAPAVREATLTKVVNTPGHAVSYRVD